MSENPTTEPTPTGGTSPASNIGDDLRALRRSRDDRMIAGVLGGLAQRLGVDPLLLRIITAVLVLFGGAGIAIYAVGWLLIPDEDAEASIAEEVLGRGPSKSPDAGTVCLAIGLALAALIATGGTFSSGMGIVLLMLAVAGAVVMMRRRDDDDDVPAAPAGDAGYPGFPGYVSPSADVLNGTTNAPAAASPGQTDASAVPDALDEGATTVTPSTDDGLAATDTTPDTDEGQAAAGATPAAASTDTSAREHAAIPDSTPEPSGSGWPDGPDWGPATSALYADIAPEPPPPERPRRRSYLGLLTVSTVAVTLGIMAINDATWAAIPAAAYIATALGIVGLGLLLGSWFGRSRGLIALGIVLGLALVPATLFDDVDWRSEGSTTLTFASVAELPDEPRSHGVGEVTYDLSDLKLTNDDDLSLEISQSIGNLRVIVPPDVDVTLDAAVRTGNIVAFDDDSSGLNAEYQDTDLGEDDAVGGGSLALDLNLRLGQIEVTRP
jgi:phage shock protein PspC (stress-responsive transcriptional regulator)